jgi:transposase
MIQKMAGPDGISAGALSRIEGISQVTLSKWLREAGTLEGMKNKHKNPRNWSTMEKLRAIMEIDQLPEEQVGAYLREKGLYDAQIKQWRQAVREALDEGALRKKRSKKAKENNKLRQLEKELRRKDRALAETAALLVLKKKAKAIWGDEDDDMTSGNDR